MIGLIIAVIVVGLLVWFVNTYLPLPAPFKTLIWVLAVIGILVYALQAFGVFGGGLGGGHGILVAN
jgi:uncharacterized protein YhhL (DUF1145 family)